MERLAVTWRAFFSAGWRSRALGYALLCWLGWIGTYRLTGHVDDPSLRWNVVFGGVGFPLLLAFLGGLRFRSTRWALSAPLVVALSMLGVSVSLVLAYRASAWFFIVLLMGIYPVLTWGAAAAGVVLSTLATDVPVRPAAKSLLLNLGGALLMALGSVPPWTLSPRRQRMARNASTVNRDAAPGPKRRLRLPGRGCDRVARLT